MKRSNPTNRVSRRKALKMTGIATTTSLLGGIGSAVPNSGKKKGQRIETALKIREAHDRDAMFKYLRNHGFEILQHSLSTRSIDLNHDQVSTQKAEKSDIELTANVYYDSYYDVFYADTDFTCVKQKDFTFDGDNGEPPKDVVGIGWESSDYDRVAGNPKGNPDSSSICSYRNGTGSGIGWEVDDAGEGDVNAGETVWEGYAICELNDEPETTTSMRSVTSYYSHSWTDSADLKSIKFGTDGTIEITMTEPTEKYWSDPLQSTDNDEQ